jgi:chaperonin GroES
MTQVMQPLYDRVVIQRAPAEERSAGGIVLPNATEKPEFGKVVAIGKGKRLENGSCATMEVKIGDTVVFGKYAGHEVKMDGTEYLILREEDIYAIVK